jgi:predicted O-methyltransferase YrrM
MEFEEARRRAFKPKTRPGGLSSPLPLMLRRRRKRGEVAGPAGLADMARDMDMRRGVEIGTFKGDWASYWCRTNPQLHLTCIDPYIPYGGRRSADTQEECYNIALKALEPYNADLIRKSSMEAVGDIEDGSLDFVSIDGDHFFDAVVQDLVHWPPKVRKGGIILLHDYTSQQGPNVIRAVDAYTHCHGITPWFVTTDSCATVFWERGVEQI